MAEDGSLSHADSEPAGASAFALAAVAVTMLDSALTRLGLVRVLAEQAVVVAVLGDRSHELGSVVAPRRALVHIANWLRLCVAHRDLRRDHGLANGCLLCLAVSLASAPFSRFPMHTE